MPAEVETRGLPLHPHPLFRVKLRYLRQRDCPPRSVLAAAEEIHLPFEIAPLPLGHLIEHPVTDGHELGPSRAYAVKGTAFDEVFQNPAV